MGFDISGLHPTHKSGEYFRNNVWWWRPLWSFCKAVTPELTDEDYVAGTYNDGHEYPKYLADTIAKNLRKALKNKRKYSQTVKDIESYLNDNPMTKEIRQKNEVVYPFSWDNVKQFTEFLETSGGFNIW